MALTERAPVPKPAIIVATSHVVRGAVGGRAAVFALERMGVPVWSLPTVLLPWHPGHGKATRLGLDAEEFAAALADLGGTPALGEVGAILTGYLGDEAQVEPLVHLVEAVKRRTPAALFLCDPVMGDEGGLFRPEALAVAIRDRLLPQADIATPNRFELAWLAGREIADNDGLIDAATKLGPKEVIVTSAFATPGEIGTLLVAKDGAHLATHRMLPDAPNGTGDLFSALYLGHRLDGVAAPIALERAVAAVLRLVEQAAELKADELPLAAGLDAFVAAPVDVTVKRVAAARGRRPV
jgi:pyridoxine kinase